MKFDRKKIRDAIMIPYGNMVRDVLMTPYDTYAEFRDDFRNAYIKKHCGHGFAYYAVVPKAVPTARPVALFMHENDADAYAEEHNGEVRVKVINLGKEF